MVRNKIVLFGAGKIGRSFIGQVFSRSGFEVVFVDINQQLVDLLNLHQQYHVVFKSNKGDETILVTQIRAVHLANTEEVVSELVDATLVVLSVGQQGMSATLPLISQALRLRKTKHGNWPLDIIIAENMRNADLYIHDKLIGLLPVDYPVDDLLGLVETSIGKMVPIMSRKDMLTDPLQVFAEPYNSLIVARKGFKNPIPKVEFLAPKENIKAWVDRKLFIHNLGHATAAYLGFQKNPRLIYIYEALSDKDIYRRTKETMLQSAEILMALYPDEFTFSQIEAHIDDLLDRFQNMALGDTIFRVGCDLYRKLSPEDRLAGPVHAAKSLGKPYHKILEVIEAAISFRATDENGNFFPSDEKFFVDAEKGIEYLLKSVCKLG